MSVGIKLRLACAGVALFATLALGAQPSGTISGGDSGVLGDWQDPTGAVIHIGRCGAQVCLWLVALSPSAPATTDIHNPDPALRSGALCGLKIGAGFNLRDPGHAFGGSLYDPKTGKTYHGTMNIEGNAAATVEGTKLDLRGYVGIPLFGESQTWTRPTAPTKPCAGPPPGE
jgi:uncharacterized protein (DUF2147 family)